MKIGVANEIAKTHLPLEAEKAGKTEKGEFDRILKNELDETASNVAKTSPPLIDTLSNIGPDSVFQPDRIAALEGTGKILDMLDVYRAKLADPAATPREIKPLIDEMEIEQKSLASVVETLPKTDGLRDILNRTLIDLSLETIRFNRGDYS